MDEKSLRTLRHDIMGRLNAINLCAAVLQTDPEADEAVEFLNDILKAADHLDQLMIQWDRHLEETEVAERNGP